MKYVYLIKSLEDSTYKIGVSKHPNRRILALQTGNPSKLILINSYQSELAYQIEKTLHCRYSHLKGEGEWFNLDISNEVKFILECQQIEEGLLTLKKCGNIFI